jgi:hypothetical protein
VVLFTAGLEDYAAPICDAIEARYPGAFHHRLYRPATVAEDVYPCIKVRFCYFFLFFHQGALRSSLLDARFPCGCLLAQLHRDSLVPCASSGVPAQSAAKVTSLISPSPPTSLLLA